MSKNEGKRVKDVARGRWPEILAHAGIPQEHLKKTHGSCPRCDGVDRFRGYDDWEQTGGFICNQCMEKGCADGFATIMWWKGCGFKEALQIVADFVGVELKRSSKGKPKKSPEEQLKFMDWNDDLAAMFLHHNPGITLEGLRLAGARMAKHQAFTVMAFPIYGQDLKTITGYVVMNCTSPVITKWANDGSVEKEMRHKTVYGSDSGLLGKYAVDQLREQPSSYKGVIKCEGLTDALAGMSSPHDGYLVCTNSSGTSENPKWMAEVLAKAAEVHVVHDADQPGQKGAECWANYIAAANTECVVKNIQLPYAVQETKGKDLRDYIREDQTTAFERIQKLAEATERVDVEKAAEAVEALIDKRCPICLTERDEHEIVDDVCEALAEDGRIYQTAGRLSEPLKESEIKDDDSGSETIKRSPDSYRISLMKSGKARYFASKVCRFFNVVKGDGGLQEERAGIPGAAINTLFSLGHWSGIPTLTTIASSPFLRPDGTIFNRPGYDPQTQSWLPPASVLPAIPEQPTKEDACQAAERLLDIVCDFPFENEGYRSAWLAGLLSPFARPAYDGCTPIFVVDANIRGSGKSKLIDLISIIVLGCDMPRTTAPDNDEEFRKRITSCVASGDSMLLVDNITGEFGGASIDAALTGTVWKDRLLGGNEMITAPMRIVWYASANNVVLKGDLPRRTCYIRLLSEHEHPEKRTDFRHSPIECYVRNNRQQFAADCLTILRAFALEGYPGNGSYSLGSFEGWSKVVRNAIVWLGYADPDSNREKIEEAADTTKQALEAIIANWNTLGGDGEYTASQIADLMGREIADHQDIREALQMICHDPSNGRKLGTAMGKLKERVVGGKYLLRRRNSAKVNVWSVKTSKEGKGACGACGSMCSGSGSVRTHDANTAEPPISTPPEEESRGSRNSDRQHMHPHTPGLPQEGLKRKTAETLEKCPSCGQDMFYGKVTGTWQCTRRECQKPASAETEGGDSGRVEVSL